MMSPPLRDVGHTRRGDTGGHDRGVQRSDDPMRRERQTARQRDEERRQDDGDGEGAGEQARYREIDGQAKHRKVNENGYLIGAASELVRATHGDGDEELAAASGTGPSTATGGGQGRMLDRDGIRGTAKTTSIATRGARSGDSMGGASKDRRATMTTLANEASWTEATATKTPMERTTHQRLQPRERRRPVSDYGPSTCCRISRDVEAIASAMDRAVKWDITALQEMGARDEEHTTDTRRGHRSYVSPSAEGCHSTAILVHRSWVNSVVEVWHGKRWTDIFM